MNELDRSERGPLKQLRSLMLDLHASDRGAEGLEKLLIIGAIVLPLLGLLILFRNKITSMLTDNWEDVADDVDLDNTDLADP